MKLGLVLIVGLILPAIAYGNGGPGPNGNKILICHKPGCDEGPVHGHFPVELWVNPNAVAGHLAHGDCLGPCEDPICCGEECDNDDCECEECQECEECDDCEECEECEECDSCCCSCQGQSGQDGQNGQDGQDGTDGVDGQDGEDGTSCTVSKVDGCATISCEDGTSVAVCDGADGVDGIDGVNGVNGEDGEPCSVTEIYIGNGRFTGILIVCPDGSTGTVLIDTDEDADSVGNGEDWCPGTPAGSEIDEFGCALVQIDDDGDSVQNSVDQCPGTPQEILVDEVGCPLEQKKPFAPQNPCACLDTEEGCGPEDYDLSGEHCNDISGNPCCLCGAGGSATLMMFIGLAFGKFRRRR